MQLLSIIPILILYLYILVSISLVSIDLEKKEQFELGNRSVDLANVLNVFFSRVFRNDKEKIEQ